jgi:hypothetical protein
MHTTADENFRPRMTRAQVAGYLSKHGYPISPRTLMNLAVRGEGPSVVGYWGRRALYDPANCLIWAAGRVRPAHPRARTGANKSGQSEVD